MAGFFFTSWVTSSDVTGTVWLVLFDLFSIWCVSQADVLQQSPCISTVTPFPGTRCTAGAALYHEEWVSLRNVCLSLQKEAQHSSVTRKAVLVFFAEKQWPSTPKEVFFFRVNDRGIFLLSLILLQRQSFLRNQPLSIASGCYRWGKVWGECLNYVQFWQLNLSPAI